MSGNPNRFPPGLDTFVRSWLRLKTWWRSRNSAPSASVRSTSGVRRSGGISASALSALTTPMWQVWRPQHISQAS